MMQLPERPTRRALGVIHAHPYLVLLGLLASLLAVWATVAFGPGIHITSRIHDLLPESAPSVQASEMLSKRLGSADILVVTLKTDQFDQVREALPKIAADLEALEDVHHVQWRLNVDMINRNALIMFPTHAELEDYYRELRKAIRDAVKKQLKLFDDDDDEVKEAPEPERTYLWGEWEHDDGLSELGRTFRRKKGAWREYFYNRAYTTIGLKVYPTKGSGDLKFCQQILDHVDVAVRESVAKHLGAIGPRAAITQIDLGGGYRDALDQSNQVRGDMLGSAATSFALLALVIILFFRSLRAFFCIMLPLVMGIAWTIGFVAITVGYLNLITAFIFAVLLGLGIDFGIHYYGRWREERAAGHDELEAMVITTRYVGASSVLAGLTTALAFLALTLADFRGFSQFGGIASIGVIYSLLAVQVGFPALAFALERWSPLRMMGYRVDRDETGAINRRRFPLGLGTLALGLAVGVAGFVAGGTSVGLELDFNKLGTKVKAGKSEVAKLQYGTTQATSPAVIFTQSADEARAIYQALDARVEAAPAKHHPIIKSYQSLFSLVPTQQVEKKALVHKICRKLKRKVKLFEGDPRDGADELLSHCDPEPFAVEDLPDWVKAKFSDRQGRLGEFIFVSPRGSINDGETALAFREEMLSLKGLDGKPPVVSGKPMVWAEVIIAMKTDGPKITIAALAVVLIMLLLVERRLRPVALILLPLTVGMGLTLGAMALFDIKLNFFNMLTLPTLIGMGVDDGVHLYHRYRECGPDSARYVVKTTGMSAVLTTLTTSIGFASLMTANHRGLNSLGLLTVIGMAAALFATLVLLPAALQWLDDRQAKQSEAS
jgi:hypothetical protein